MTNMIVGRRATDLKPTLLPLDPHRNPALTNQRRSCCDRTDSLFLYFPPTTNAAVLRSGTADDAVGFLDEFLMPGIGPPAFGRHHDF
jgi:hypothetical protein